MLPAVTFGLLIVLVFGEPVALAQCPDRIPMAEVAASLGRVDAAWTALDPLALSGAVAELRARTECIDEALKPSQVASIMRAFAMADFVDKNKASAILYFAASRAANPAYTIPESLAGQNHPIRTAFDDASAVPTDTTTLPTPAAGWITIDGVRGLDSPSARPWLFQRFDADGVLLITALVAAGAAAPKYAVAAVVVEPPPEARPRATLELLAGGLIHQRHAPGNVLFELAPAVTLPAGPLRVELGVAGAIGRDEGSTVIVPLLRAGVLREFGADEVRGRIGAAFLATSHPDARFLPGGVVTGGARVGPVLVDLAVGYSGGFTAALTTGVAVDL